jgi:hypothetical protein
LQLPTGLAWNSAQLGSGSHSVAIAPRCRYSTASGNAEHLDANHRPARRPADLGSWPTVSVVVRAGFSASPLLYFSAVRRGLPFNRVGGWTSDRRSGARRQAAASNTWRRRVFTQEMAIDKTMTKTLAATRNRAACVSRRFDGQQILWGDTGGLSRVDEWSIRGPRSAAGPTRQNPRSKPAPGDDFGMAWIG